MNDDSDPQLRAWFRHALPGEPDSLHEFLMRIPTTHRREAEPGPPAAFLRSRSTAIGLVAIAAVGLIGGLVYLVDLDRRTGLGTGQAPSVSASPAAALPAALAQLPQASASSPQQLPFADAYWGPESYAIDWTSGAVVGLAGPWAGSVEVPLTQTEIEAHGTKGATGISVAADSRELALVVWHSVGPAGEPRIPCPDVVALPRAWRILVAPLDPSGKPGPLVPFATGESPIAFDGPMGGEGCRATSAPSASVSNGLIAYAVDDATAERPYGSRILVRSLADGSVMRDLATPTRVLSLELAGSSVAWLEADGNWPKALPLRITTSAHPGAQDVEVFATPGDQMGWSVPRFSLSDTALAWERFGTGQVWMRDLVAGTDRRVSPEDSACLLGGMDAGVVAMNCGDDTSGLDANVAFAPWLVLWSADVGPRLVVGLPPLQAEELSDGWVVVRPNDGKSVQGFAVGSLTGH